MQGSAELDPQRRKALPESEAPGFPCRLAIKKLTFVPYGDAVDGSAESEQYSAFLAGYLRERLMPVLDAWEGEMPEHVRKVGGASARMLWQDLKSKLTAQGGLVCAGAAFSAA